MVPRTLSQARWKFLGETALPGRRPEEPGTGVRPDEALEVLLQRRQDVLGDVQRAPA
ncbi:MAG: hypothetical protein ACRDZX_08175 [Acidimicrobiales bacterium]